MHFNHYSLLELKRIYSVDIVRRVAVFRNLQLLNLEQSLQNSESHYTLIPLHGCMHPVNLLMSSFLT